MVSKRFRPFSLRLLSCAAAASALAALLAPRREGRSMAAMLSPPVSRPRVCRVGSCSETPARTSRVRGNGSRAIGGSKFGIVRAFAGKCAPKNEFRYQSTDPNRTTRVVLERRDEADPTSPQPSTRARAGRRHVADRPPRTGARPRASTRTRATRGARLERTIAAPVDARLRPSTTSTSRAPRPSALERRGGSTARALRATFTNRTPARPNVRAASSSSSSPSSPESDPDADWVTSNSDAVRAAPLAAGGASVVALLLNRVLDASPPSPTRAPPNPAPTSCVSRWPAA